MIQPTRDIVLIKADKPKQTTTAGLYIAEDWKTIPPTGTVLAIGEDVMDVDVGDRVVFERYASIIMEDDERLCKEIHILATIEEEAEDASN